MKTPSDFASTASTTGCSNAKHAMLTRSAALLHAIALAFLAAAIVASRWRNAVSGLNEEIEFAVAFGGMSSCVIWFWSLLWLYRAARARPRGVLFRWLVAVLALELACAALAPIMLDSSIRRSALGYLKPDEFPPIVFAPSLLLAVLLAVPVAW